MKLYRIPKGYALEISFDNRGLAKSAGFEWDGNAKRWWTPSQSAALKFTDCANPELKAELLEARKKSEAALTASYAADADFDPPHPEGLEFFPFQRAGIAYCLSKFGFDFIPSPIDYGSGGNENAIRCISKDKESTECSEEESGDGPLPGGTSGSCRKIESERSETRVEGRAIEEGNSGNAQARSEGATPSRPEESHKNSRPQLQGREWMPPGQACGGTVAETSTFGVRNGIPSEDSGALNAAQGSNLLQGRLRKPGTEDSNRTGRPLSRPDAEKNSGPEKERGSTVARLASDPPPASCGVLIADEPGLGKTIQSIGVLNCLDPEGRFQVLVVCPASLKINWMREIEKWSTAPSLFTGSLRGQEIGIAKGYNFFPNTSIVICNYDILHAHKEIISARKWDLVIADEIHLCKSHKKKRAEDPVTGKSKWVYKTRRVEALMTIEADYRIGCSGTPILNHPEEMWTIVHWLRPDIWKSKQAYFKQYCPLEIGGRNETYGVANLDRLQAELRAHVMVRRMKKDVLKELPPKIRQIIELPADDDERGAVADEWTAKARIDEALMRLRVASQLAKASEKDEDYRAAVEALKEGVSQAFAVMALERKRVALAKVPYMIAHIQDTLETGEPVVFFAYHHEVVDKLREAFKDKHVCITGRTPLAERQRAVDIFQAGKAPLFIGNIQAAGVGITLTASSTVIFGELSWVPADLSQAEDRCLDGKQLVICLQSVHSNRMSIKMIRDIKVGDVVVTGSGREASVSKVFKRTNIDGRMTKIVYTGWSEPIECTYDHKFLVARKGETELNWVEAHNILPCDNLVFPRPSGGVPLKRVTVDDRWRRYKPQPKHCSASGCKEPIEARLMCRVHYREWLSKNQSKRPKGNQYTNGRYVRLPDWVKIDDDWLFLFGWYVAEGFSSISKGKSDFVSLSGHEKEREILHRCGSVFRRLGINYTIYTKKGQRGIELRAYSTELAHWFRDWFGHGAGNKQLPKVLMDMPPGQCEHFLSGYVSGDGYTRNGNVEWVSASRELCYQICMMAAKCGYDPTMRRGSKQSGHHFIGGFARSNYSKSAYVARKVRSVKSYYEKRPHVYDITVDHPDHSFIIGFAVTHNCHRIGQLDSVLVQHLVLEGSLDAVMAKRIVEKQKIIDAALNDEVGVEHLQDVEVAAVEDSDEPATAEVTRKQVVAEAIRLLPEDVAFIHATLQIVAGMDSDYAHGKNAMGFNKVDSEIGHSLAEARRLTPKMAVLALKLCHRYRGQLPAEIAEELEKIQGNCG